MIAGHGAITEDLKRLASKKQGGGLSHGYVFHGPSMVGKRAVAQALAKFLEKGEFDVLNEGEALRDLKVIDMAFMRQFDADVKNSISIDAVREVKNYLWQKPDASPRRTLIIDDAEFLTTQAQNALLKVTEEPPASALLILITSDEESIMPTILSRLQKIYFGAVPEEDVVNWLEKERKIVRTKAVTLAKRALGKPGLALRLGTDEAFGEQLELAEKFLKSAPTGRRDFIKKLIEPDEFNLRSFLDAVIIVLASEKPSKAKAAIWHKTLALYGKVTDFGLNPRLQLETLLM